MPISQEDIKKFDAALSVHMSLSFGENWRSMCHQSAKVACFALRATHPGIQVSLCRVELVGHMVGAERFVHIGYPDGVKIDGKFPAHYAVTAEDALYDPTFWQLRNCKTPLDLPEEDYFFSETFLEQVKNADYSGFVWAGQQRPSGYLRVGYKIHTGLYPNSAIEHIMNDAEAQRHARLVSDLFKRHA